MANPSNVAAGLKSTLSNPHTSQEAKDNARERLENEFSEDKSSSGEGIVIGDGKNPGNVIGGIKAAINNPNVSDAKKEELKEKLDGGL